MWQRSDFHNERTNTEMIIEGLQYIDDSPTLRLLFDMSKEWMDDATRSERGETGERKMRILPKTIGRNSGFVVNILSASHTLITTFYAKAQEVSMDTVLIHHLLKNMKCGPDVFYIPLLERSGRLYHGVITEKVKGWSMASTLTRVEKEELLDEGDRLISTTFLLNILIELGQFGNIPNNRDNWGFINNADQQVPYPGFSLVDFSCGGSPRRRFEKEESFLNRWRGCLNYLVSKWQNNLGSEDDRGFALDYALQRDAAIEEQSGLFPFLKSSEIFTKVLQTACDATALWLHEAIESARNRSMLDVNARVERAHFTLADLPDLEAILTPFRCFPWPNTSGISIYYKSIVEEYLDLVAEWNTSLKALYSWFPFTFDEHGLRSESWRYNLHNLSMVVNVSDGDVGKDTERKERFVAPETSNDDNTIAIVDASASVPVSSELKLAAASGERVQEKKKRKRYRNRRRGTTKKISNLVASAAAPVDTTRIAVPGELKLAFESGARANKKIRMMKRQRRRKANKKMSNINASGAAPVTTADTAVPGELKLAVKSDARANGKKVRKRKRIRNSRHRTTKKESNVDASAAIPVATTRTAVPGEQKLADDCGARANEKIRVMKRHRRPRASKKISSINASGAVLVASADTAFSEEQKPFAEFKRTNEKKKVTIRNRRRRASKRESKK